MTLINSNNKLDYINQNQGSLTEHFLGANYAVNALATGCLGLSGSVATGTITNVADPLILNTTSIRLSTGASATGRASLLSGLNINYAGSSSNSYISYETRIIIPVLSTTTQTYVISLGLTNSTTASTRHIRFITGNGTIRGACSNGVESLTSTTNILANTWYTLKCIIFSNLYCDFLVNGTWIGSLNTNLPLNSPVGVNANIVKTLGTTSTHFFIDYIKLNWNF